MSPSSFDLEGRYRLSPAAALRPEPFGALAYHFGNRRLTFLKSPTLVRVVQTLADHDTARGALAAAGVPPPRWPSYERALASLLHAEIIECLDPSQPNGQPADRSSSTSSEDSTRRSASPGN